MSMTREQIEKLRLSAAADFVKGMSQGDDARKYGVSTATTGRWWLRYSQGHGRDEVQEGT